MRVETTAGIEKNLKFLVTGGRGVLGKRVMSLLSSNQNYEVTCLAGHIKDRESVRDFFSQTNHLQIQDTPQSAL
jgi:hypothetical protein